MFFKVHVQSRTACKVFDIWCAMKLELVDYAKRVVFHYIEIAVVTVSWNEISVFPIPFGMFYSYVFCWYHLAVEQHILCSVLLVVFFYYSKNVLYELFVVGVVCYLKAAEFRSLYESVYSNGELLS